MRSKSRLILSLTFLLLATALLPAQGDEKAPPDQNFTVTSNVTYTQGANGPLQADVYIPKGSGPFPGIVFIHGGGWLNGNRSQMIKLIKALAEAGYVGFTIDYDVDPVHYPASFKESLDAVRFFRAHAAEYHLDPLHIAVAGSSAGGELAALVALNPGGPGSANHPDPANRVVDTTAQVRAAVILNGALDLTAQGDSSKSVTDYLGGPCSTLMTICKEASPQYNIHHGAPAFYVGHGDQDQSVPFQQAVAFTNALEAASVPMQFFQASGGRHTYWADPRFYEANLAAIKVFLAKHLR